MPADVLAREFFQPGIERVAMVVDFGHVVVAYQAGALARGMPGGAGSQLPFFNQQHVAATRLGQVIQQADSHDPTTHNNDTSMIVHWFFPQSNCSAFASCPSSAASTRSAFIGNR